MQSKSLIWVCVVWIAMTGQFAHAASTLTPVRVALVLGSGGARGYAHVGVIKALAKAGVPIDLIVGASAGSLIGSLYADNTDAAALENTLLSTNLSTFVDINLLPAHGGLVTGAKEQQFLASHLRARHFRQLNIKFATVATNLMTGEAVILDRGPLIPALLASSALPGLVRPVHLQGLTLVDGGAAMPVPVALAASYHPQIIIAVDVSEPLPEKLPITAWGIYSRSQSIIWRHLTAASLTGADIVIQPSVGQTNTFALNQRARLIKIGEQATQTDLPKILKLLHQKHINLLGNKDAQTQRSYSR